jgi:hypothetical protein
MDIKKGEAVGTKVGSRTILHAGRLRARMPMRSLDFVLNRHNHSICIMGLVLTQPLVENSTRKSFWGKARRAHKTENLIAFCEPIA